MVADDLSTRERIIREALDLFSRKGVANTPIAEIEDAAGLSPGSGAFYRHFDDKKDLLEVSIQQHIEDLEPLDSMMDTLPLGDLESEVKFLMNIGKQFIEQNHKIYLAILSLGENESELLERYRDTIISRASEVATEWAEERGEDLSIHAKNFDIAINVAINAITHYQLLETTFDHRSANVDLDGYIDVLLEMILSYVNPEN